ncbi:MAG: NAD(P)H-binding protein [Planctomycetota bacterium]|nr:NAD(P)H-binding protein [Planctomycetota bacterium]
MTHIAYVAGATGYTGQAVLAELKARSIQTIAHIRPNSPRLEQWRPRLEEMGITLDSSEWNKEAMEKSLERHKPTLIFSLLGTTKARMKQTAKNGGDKEKQSYQWVDYSLPKMLLDAALAKSPEARFLFLSSAGVKANSGMEYLELRWQLEQDIQKSGIDFTIARPSFITGANREEDRPGERFAATVVDGALGLVALFGAKKLKERYRSVTNEELAKGLVSQALSEASSKKILELDDIRRD